MVTTPMWSSKTPDFLCLLSAKLMYIIELHHFWTSRPEVKIEDLTRAAHPVKSRGWIVVKPSPAGTGDCSIPSVRIRQTGVLGAVPLTRNTLWAQIRNGFVYTKGLLARLFKTALRRFIGQYVAIFQKQPVNRCNAKMQSGEGLGVTSNITPLLDDSSRSRIQNPDARLVFPFPFKTGEGHKKTGTSIRNSPLKKSNEWWRN